jgi:hypothetical protein
MGVEQPVTLRGEHRLRVHENKGAEEREYFELQGSNHRLEKNV